MYPVGSSDPNQMRDQDFIEGKKCNYYILQNPRRPTEKRGSVSNVEEGETPLVQAAATVDKTGYTFGKSHPTARP